MADEAVLNDIRNIENRYGLIPFRMSLIHLMDVGINNMGDAAVEAGIKQIMAKGEADKTNDVHSFLTPEFQCEILRCSAELAKYTPWTLFVYIKKYVHIDVA